MASTDIRAATALAQGGLSPLRGPPARRPNIPRIGGSRDRSRGLGSETTQKQQDLANDAAVLADRKRELDRQEGILKGDLEEFKATQMLHAADHEAKAAVMMAEITQQRQNSEAELQRTRDEVAASLREMRAKARQDIGFDRTVLGLVQNADAGLGHFRVHPAARYITDHAVSQVRTLAGVQAGRASS